MEKLQFQIKVNAPAAKAFDIMLGISNIQTYQKWTAVFNPTSTYEGTWAKGSKILFTGVDENGNRGGMVSQVAEFIPLKFVSIRHIGILEGDTEITEGPKVEPWSGGFENYTFSESNGKTTIAVEIDVVPDFKEYFESTYPNALLKLKEIVESKN